MRIALDIDEKKIQALDMLSKATQRSRAELIRDAIEHYLVRQSADGYALWGDTSIDGLTYQEKIRGEW